MKTLFTFCFLFISWCLMAQETELYHQAKINFQGDDIARLGALGIPLDHGELIPNESITCDFSETEIALAEAAGFEVEILINDVVQFYQDRNLKFKDWTMDDFRAVNISGCNGPVYATPENFNFGSVAGFYTYQEILDHLDNMATTFPNLITVKQAIDPSLTTHDGHSVYYVKISDNPNMDEAEPEILYDALHHAREPESAAQLIFYMYYLLENYGSDDYVTNLVDNREMYFVPVVNPDGYDYNMTSQPSGGGMWRKNRRDNGDGTYGVDLNRNYGYNWGYDNSGSSGNTSSAVYRGPSAFSEPATQMMRDFCVAHDFKISLNCHSYGDVVFYPWGYVDGVLTPDYDYYSTIASNMCRYNCYDHGQGAIISYLTNGDADDWMYGEQTVKDKIISFTPEVGRNGQDGFWPAMDRIIPLASENVWPNLQAAYYAGEAVTAQDLTPTNVNSLNATIEFNFEKVGLTDGATYTFSLNPISSNIINVGAPAVFSGLNLLQVSAGSIAYDLAPTTAPGEMIEMELVMDNGDFSLSIPIKKYYQADVVFADNFSIDAAWDGNWQIINSDFVSSPFCITDSSWGDYSANNSGNDSYIETINPIDLSNYSAAILSFWGKWDIERCVDRVQIFASTDATNWSPLCGRQSFATENGALTGEAVYDDVQDDWVLEEIDLSAYVDQSVYLRFELYSNYNTNADGFYLDDVSILGIQDEASVQLQAFLEGPYLVNGSMRTDLETQNLLPNAQPFNQAPWNYNGSESMTTSLTDIVDWALVELRDMNDNTSIVGQTAALLQNDGTLISSNGSALVRFPGIPAGDYYVSIKVRNHLAVMSANAISLPNATALDFSDPTQLSEAASVFDMGDGYYALYAGDFNADGAMTVLDFNEYTADTENILNYIANDCNMDGLVTIHDYNLYRKNMSQIAAPPLQY